MRTIDKVCCALSDLEDLEEECNAALLQYPEGKVSAIFTHNCIQNATEMLSQWKRELKEDCL